MSTCPEPWGGSEELWWGVAVVLRERGHDVDVLKTHVAHDQPRIRALRELSCRVRELDRPASKRGWAIANALMPARYTLDVSRRRMMVAARALLGRPCSMAVISQGQSLDGLYLADLCRRLRVAYVVISHKASELQWPADFERDYCAAALSSARLAIFVSQRNRILTEEQIGTPLANAVVVRNPVMAGREGPLPWPEHARHQTRIACVGRLYVPEKGPGSAPARACEGAVAAAAAARVLLRRRHPP